jgi:hypothetical protein
MVVLLLVKKNTTTTTTPDMILSHFQVTYEADLVSSLRRGSKKRKMEDDLKKTQKQFSKNNNIYENGRQTSIFLKQGDNLNFFENGRQPKKRFNHKQTKVKTMVVAPLRVT